MTAHSPYNFPFEKWAAQEALVQQLRDAASLADLRRLEDSLPLHAGSGGVLAALGWNRATLTAEAWKAYTQEQQQAQQQ